MPLSSDPKARAKQLANLKSTSALKHGARSESIVRESSSEIYAELQQQYPAESDHWLRLQARRLAKIARIGAYLESRPNEVLNVRTGKLNPAAAEEEALTKGVLADFERADQRKRDAHGKPAHGLEQLRQRGAQIIDQREAAGGE